MDARSIIARLRNGETPPAAEIEWFAHGLASGEVSDAQAGAFAMAVCLNGISEAGRVALTAAMCNSGDRMNWSVAGPVLDKHSTGGVGDCVSLLLAPALAASGAYVPMISGRGLGHTGGTLDKLEAIPGLSTEVSTEDFQQIVGDIGFAIASASGDIAPADRRLYAVRDVTATVDSIDLITASILSKKLAAGLDGLVLDVKWGSGAFMATASDAHSLAETLVQTANGAGTPTTALVTDMNQPLAQNMGNALEVISVMELLTAPKDCALIDLTQRLGGALLASSGIVDSAEQGAQRIRQAIYGGQAAEGFGRMVARMGGPKDFVECWRDRLPASRYEIPVLAQSSGYVHAIDGKALGNIVVKLGGGRLVGSDKINPSVGLANVARLGTMIESGTPLLNIHCEDKAQGEQLVCEVQEAFTLSEYKPEPRVLVVEKVE
ncbi:thymidine phosphorylase [Falsihalocynthiibacter sp. SS001]|uniref:thymidine phosphorylase n=1 Tax=Falsihalocynthiibacter sp. SS001 TaxID=3349698 RepID=UPI0036D3BEAE